MRLLTWPLLLLALLALQVAKSFVSPSRRPWALMISCWAGMVAFPALGLHFLAGAVMVSFLWMIGLTHDAA